MQGRVSHGRGQGRELGFPTANLDAFCDWEAGVYAVLVKLRGRTFGGLAGVKDRRLEVHILGWNGELYGDMLEVEPYAKIRGPASPWPRGAGLRQIDEDKRSARHILLQNHL